MRPGLWPGLQRTGDTARAHARQHKATETDTAVFKRESRMYQALAHQIDPIRITHAEPRRLHLCSACRAEHAKRHRQQNKRPVQTQTVHRWFVLHIVHTISDILWEQSPRQEQQSHRGGSTTNSAVHRFDQDFRPADQDQGMPNQGNYHNCR